MYMTSCKRYKKDDDYETPKSAWEAIKPYLPLDKVAYDPFICSGRSVEFFEELNILHNEPQGDFFENEINGDYVLSNPPFTLKKETLQRLVNELDVPFIMIMPSQTINAVYFREIFKSKEDLLQIAIPRKRINFIKDGEVKKGCAFDCFYFCYKMNLPSSIVFLN